VLSAGDHVLGLRFQPGGDVNQFAIDLAAGGGRIERNTFQSGYGGIQAEQDANGVIRDNFFGTNSYCIHAVALATTSSLAISANDFSTPAFGVDVNNGSAVIRGNRFDDNAQTGIQVQAGTPQILDNRFLRAMGSNYGCVHISGSPVLRHNTCVNGTETGG